MYPNLNAELARLGWSRKVLADKLEVRYATILDKLNGKYPLTYDECVRIKNLMGADIPLEVLFFYRVIRNIELNYKRRYSP